MAQIVTPTETVTVTVTVTEKFGAQRKIWILEEKFGINCDIQIQIQIQIQIHMLKRCNLGMTLTCVWVRCRASCYKETAFSGFNFIPGLNFKPGLFLKSHIVQALHCVKWSNFGVDLVIKHFATTTLVLVRSNFHLKFVNF